MQFPISLRPVVLVAFSLATTTVAHAQRLADHPRVAEAANLLETWLDAELAYDDIPGISAGVVADQELVWSKGFGYANLDRRTPATPSTMYSICSISKLFTSISIMQLRDQGRFDLNDEVGSLLPWFDLKQAYAEAPPVTVEGILTHSAGLPRESDYPYWTDPFPFPTQKEVVARLASQETLYPPWKYFQYSNLGLTLAGEIVAHTSGMPFTAYVQRNVLDPLGMTSTVPEIGEAWGRAEMATGYSAPRRSGERKQVKSFAGRGIGPAMSFASTVEDLARFASWQFRLLEEGGREIIDANTLREMHRVHWVDPSWETTWGLGFSISRRDDETFVGHGGGCPGFLTQLQIQPDKQIATIAMVNANGTNPGLIARRIYDIMAPALEAAQDEDGEEPTRLAPDLQKFVGAYDSYPWGGESAVIPWKGALTVVGLPTNDPLGSMMRLKHVDGNRFRRIRDDDSLGEEIRFDVDGNGNVLRMWRHSNSSERINR